MHVLMPFEDLHMELSGVFVGLFEGVAEIDFNGRILGITLMGWDGFRHGAKPKNTYLPIPERTEMTWEGMFATTLAIEIYKQFSDDISGTIADRVAELRSAFRDPGPSHHQRL